MAKILLIDDDPAIVSLLEKFLVGEGHTVVTAGNGLKGVEFLSNNLFDLVITDIIMPDQDGMFVLMALQKLPQKPKTIVISGGSPLLDQDLMFKTAKLLTADAVIPKPFELKLLSNTIYRLLNESDRYSRR